MEMAGLTGPGHIMECKVLLSMEVKVAIPGSCYAFNSMEFHGIARLAIKICVAVYNMEISMLLKG